MAVMAPEQKREQAFATARAADQREIDGILQTGSADGYGWGDESIRFRTDIGLSAEGVIPGANEFALRGPSIKK